MSASNSSSASASHSGASGSDAGPSRSKVSNQTAVILGATGATGEPLLGLLLADPAFSKVVSIGRRKITFGDKKRAGQAKKKLKQVVLDSLADMDDAEAYFEGADVVFCCLGTTRSNAGSDAAFRAIDLDAVVNAATLAHQHGVRHFSVVSSVGANKDSCFLYMSTKGRMEFLVRELDFPVTSIYRPGMLGRGDKARAVEKCCCCLGNLRVETLAEGMLAEYHVHANDGRKESGMSLGGIKKKLTGKGKKAKENAAPIVNIYDDSQIRAFVYDYEHPQV